VIGLKTRSLLEVCVGYFVRKPEVYSKFGGSILCLKTPQQKLRDVLSDIIDIE